MPSKNQRYIIMFVIVISGVGLLIAAIKSLDWRYVHDSPLMIYAGFLISKGVVPYHDLFDMNTPGIYWVMVFMGKVFGWNDIAFRIFDLLCLATIAVLTFIWMRPIGNLSALVASVSFPLWYLACGRRMTLQREYVALLPFTAMMAVVTIKTNIKFITRVFLTGIMMGIVILLKPPFLIFSIPVIIFLIYQNTSSRCLFQTVLTFVGGLFVPLCACAFYLIWTESLKPFLDIAINYWPLYTHMTDEHQPIDGINRLLYIVKSTGFGLCKFSILGIMAIVGIRIFSRTKKEKGYEYLLIGLLVTSSLYPAVSGQFWTYHWLPFHYVTLCASSLIIHQPLKRLRLIDITPVIAVILMLLSLTFLSVSRRGLYTLYWWSEEYAESSIPKDGVPDMVAHFLNVNMKSGDTVQPLDWTGGAVHGMLMAQAPLATRFMYDFHFYHHISSPYIQTLRKEFMEELAIKKPRFIIQVLKNKPWPYGKDTTRNFPELKAFLERYYKPVQTGESYNILAKKDELPNKQENL